MPVCPSGHPSESADYCDVCGDRMEGPAGPTREKDPAGAPGRDAACPRCGTPRSGRFCEADGDRVHVGAWTTITLLLEEGPP